MCNCRNSTNTYRPTVTPQSGPFAEPETTCTPDTGAWQESFRKLTCLKQAGAAAQLNTSVAHINSYLGLLQTMLNADNPCPYLPNLVHIDALLQLAHERNIPC